MTEATAASSETPEPRRRWSKRLVLVLAGLLVGLALTETTLWCLGQPRFYKSHTFPPQFMFVGAPEADGRVRHVNKPSTTIRFVYDGNPRGYFGNANQVEHVTNSLGFRGPEFPLVEQADGSVVAVGKKPAGVRRIVFLGDSVTFGEGVKLQDTFVEKTRSRLEDLGHSVEVYNFGVGGHNTSDALWAWQRYAGKLDADVIVLGFVLNDAEEGLFRLDPSTGIPVRVPRTIETVQARLTGPPAGLLYLSRLAQSAWKGTAARELSSATLAHYRGVLDPTGSGWRSCVESIRELQQAGPPLVVVVFPPLFRLGESYPFTDVHARLQELCGSPRTIDLLDRLQAWVGREESLWVHPTDQHPNEVVHRTASRGLVEVLPPLWNGP